MDGVFVLVRGSVVEGFLACFLLYASELLELKQNNSEWLTKLLSNLLSMVAPAPGRSRIRNKKVVSRVFLVSKFSVVVAKMPGECTGC